MADVANRRLHPRAILLGFHHEAQEFLRGFRIFGVLVDHLIEEQIELGGHTAGPNRHVGMLDVLGYFLQLRIARRLRRVVNRDAVGGDADLVIKERLVVVRVEPGQRAGHERGVELLRVFERLDGLGAVDHHLVFFVNQATAVRPDEPVRPRLIAGRMPEREAARRAIGLERLHELQEARVVFRESVKTSGLDLALPIHDGVTGAAQRQRNPLVVALQIRFANGIPAAVFFSEIVGQIGHIDQFFRIQIGVVIGRKNDVRAGTGVGGNGRFRAHIFPTLVIHAHFDARLRNEFFDVGHVLVFVALHEALPAQHAELRALFRLVIPLRLSRAVPQHRGRSGDTSSDRGGLKKLAAINR